MRIGEYGTRFRQQSRILVIFMRRYWFSDSYKDIASQLGLSEKAVSVRLTRIRRQLREFLIQKKVFV